MSFEPTKKSIRSHKVPDWFHDAKFGIFIHLLLLHDLDYPSCTLFSSKAIRQCDNPEGAFVRYS